MKVIQAFILVFEITDFNFALQLPMWP